MEIGVVAVIPYGVDDQCRRHRSVVEVLEIVAVIGGTFAKAVHLDAPVAVPRLSHSSQSLLDQLPYVVAGVLSNLPADPSCVAPVHVCEIAPPKVGGDDCS